MVRFRLPKDGSGIGAHYDYSPIIPSCGREVLEWVRTAKKYVSFLFSLPLPLPCLSLLLILHPTSSPNPRIIITSQSPRVCEAESFDLFCDFFMHERHVIFVNMMTFDKTNPDHRQSVENIFQNLFAEGRKRGYSKYRSHINTMGTSSSAFPFILESIVDMDG